MYVSLLATGWDMGLPQFLVLPMPAADPEDEKNSYKNAILTIK